MLKSDYDIWYKREKHNDDTSLKIETWEGDKFIHGKRKKSQRKYFAKIKKLPIYRYAFDKNVDLNWSSIIR